MTKIIISMVGHTAAGKTSLAHAISDRFNFPLISEGTIKRSLVEKYETQQSLDECLRDLGYKKAIEQVAISLSQTNYAIIDASFHKDYRRNWLRTISGNLNCFLLWLYCNCSDLDEVTRRIAIRHAQPRTTDTQADSMDIFYHIINSFDELKIVNHEQEAILHIDTFRNTILKSEPNNIANCKDIIDFIDEYLKKRRHNG